MREFERLISSPLLEAELKSACKREDVLLPQDFLSDISWILPDRALTEEIDRILETGYLRCADLWHLAVALYMSPQPSDASFLSLDRKQLSVARQLGFQTMQL